MNAVSNHLFYDTSAYLAAATEKPKPAPTQTRTPEEQERIREATWEKLGGAQNWKPGDPVLSATQDPDPASSATLPKRNTFVEVPGSDRHALSDFLFAPRSTNPPATHPTPIQSSAPTSAPLNIPLPEPETVAGITALGALGAGLLYLVGAVVAAPFGGSMT